MGIPVGYGGQYEDYLAIEGVCKDYTFIDFI